MAKTIQSSLRSVSLGRGIEPATFTRGRTLLQRGWAGLRRSFNSREKVHQPVTAVQSAAEVPRRTDDPDWVFFRGRDEHSIYIFK